MGIKERVIEILGGVTQTTVSKRAHESYKEGYNDRGEDEPSSGGLRRYGYRTSITSGMRDFESLDWTSILETVWLTWASNPVAARALEIKRDYILGRGIQIQTDDERLQEILDDFWLTNKMDRRLREFTLQLFLFGVQCLPVFVREADGLVRLGYIDPGEIEKVYTHPDNALELWAVVLKQQGGKIESWQGTQDRRVFRIIREAVPVFREDISIEQGGTWESPDLKYVGKLATAKQAVLEDWEREMLKANGLSEYSGSCFYERVNAVSNQALGWSDLLQLADWLDQLRETLWALVDREQMASYFSWDVEMTDANPDAIAKRQTELIKRPPKRGSVRVHNQNEQWRMDYPDLKQTGSVETSNAVLTFILGGFGIPRHWYGHGDETNRATAQAQGDPTWRSLEHDQGIIKEWIVAMLEFVRDQAMIAGEWTPSLDEQGEIKVIMPEMTSKDLNAVAAAATAIAQALMIAVESGWLSRETAAEVWANVMAELDVEINVSEELEAAAQELTAAGLADQERRNGQLAQLLNGVDIPGEGEPAVTGWPE